IWPGQDSTYNILVEGAWIDCHDGYYYLYYSGDNCCGDKANYAVMVARSSSALGPFERYGEANGTGSSVILEKDSTWIAPGHNSIIRDRENSWIVYHAIDKANKTMEVGIAGDRDDLRVLCINPIEYVNGWPVVK